MAFNIDYSGALAQGRNTGQALAGLGQTLGNSFQQNKQQAQMQELVKTAMSGDKAALETLYSVNPELGKQVEDRQFNAEDRGLAAGQREQQKYEDRWKTPIAQKTGDVVALIAQAKTDQEKTAIFEKYLPDETVDIDEEDRQFFMDKAKQHEIILKTKGKEVADSIFGADFNKDNLKLTTKQKDFREYQELKKTDPEAAKMFAVGAGFAEDQNNKVFQIVDDTMVFSDGSTKPITESSEIKTPDMRSTMSQKKALKIIDNAKEGQLKNAGFAITMNDGTQKVDKMMSEGYDPMSAAWVNKYLAGTTIGNLAMSEEDQTFVGAVEQMINAIARRETGAAITEFERKDFFNRYMPTAGDKPERIKQKKAALERQFKSIRGQAGSAYEAIRTTQGFGSESSEQTAKSVNWADL